HPRDLQQRECLLCMDALSVLMPEFRTFPKLKISIKTMCNGIAPKNNATFITFWQSSTGQNAPQLMY
ncbi:hypothetical protein, partial [Citrobacter sp. NCU1]|uniref:hypothetical protein n=1 Tax=Citrobacter sp. NCU1 TaxID=2026683 RepID=UPI001EE30C77